MTSERSQAYGRVMRTISDLAASKLHAEEQETVRDAADVLLFCEDLDADPAAREALERVRDLAAGLVANERFLLETAERLVADIEACGPLPLAATAR